MNPMDMNYSPMRVYRSMTASSIANIDTTPVMILPPLSSENLSQRKQNLLLLSG